MSTSRLQQLAERGQSVWIDFLSREFVHGGELERMVEEDAVTGITSNPTIFQQAIEKGQDYDEQLRELLAESDDPAEVHRLESVRQSVVERQREAIAALERLRLQLLRAVAERRATADLTHHLEVAHELERSLIADLAGHAELRRYLARVSRPEHRSDSTPTPTPRPTTRVAA